MDTPRLDDAHPPLELIGAEPLLTPEYEVRPTAVYERLRARYGPVAPVDVFGVPVWLVMGYSQVLEVMRDSRGIWSKRLESWRALNEGLVPADWPLMAIYSVRSSAFLDGAEMARLRGAWSAGLRPFQDRTRPQAKELEYAVSQYADDLITMLAEGGRTGQADLSAQYARALPLMVVNRLLGFSGAQGDELLIDLWRMLDAGPDSAEAVGRLMAAMSQVCAARATEPGDDLPSHMLAAVPDLTVDELVRELMMVPGLIGDYIGTLICSTIAEVIAGDGGMRDSVSSGMMQEVVNRATIAAPPMPNAPFRYPKTDVRMGRFRIAAGDPVMISPAAAHSDPAFTGGMDPGAIYSSRAHLAWGAGPHACAGRELATTVTTIAVTKLFERFSALRLATPPERLGWRASPLSRSLRSLPVHYELSSEPPPRSPAGPPAEQTGAQDTGGQDTGGQDTGGQDEETDGSASFGLSLARRLMRALRRF